MLTKYIFKVIKFSKLKDIFYKLDMDSSDMLDPINELMDKYLSTWISIFASSIGTKGDNANLDVGSIRTLDQCWTSGVTETSTSAGHSGGTHHCLGDHWTVQITAHCIIQDLNVDLVQSIRVDAIWKEEKRFEAWNAKIQWILRGRRRQRTKTILRIFLQFFS